MHEAMRRPNKSNSSLSRKFTASNGEDYRWIYRGVKEHEWLVSQAIVVIFHQHWLIGATSASTLATTLLRNTL